MRYEPPEATREGRHPVCSASQVVDVPDVTHTIAGLKADVHRQARNHGLASVEPPHVDTETIITASGRTRILVAVTMTCAPADCGLLDPIPPSAAFPPAEACLVTEVCGDDGGLFGAAASATFSRDRRYRYTLTRRWGTGGDVCFVMLNPSTADAFTLDPTVRRCIGYARRLGAGGITVVNLFALRSTDPRELYATGDPVGEHNDAAIRAAAESAAVVVAAWGVHGALLGRAACVMELLDDVPLFRLGDTTKEGEPRHPLYLKGSAPLDVHHDRAVISNA